MTIFFVYQNREQVTAYIWERGADGNIHFQEIRQMKVAAVNAFFGERDYPTSFEIPEWPTLL